MLTEMEGHSVTDGEGCAVADAASGDAGPGGGAAGVPPTDPLGALPLPHCLSDTSGTFSPSASLSVKWVLQNVFRPPCQAFHWRCERDPPRQPL